MRLPKSTLVPTLVGGFSPPINVTSITTDKYGYVTVTFGEFTNLTGGIYIFAPNGTLEADGGPAEFMLDTTMGISTSALPPMPTYDGPGPRIEVRPKSAQDNVQQ